jgi:hypothetical protein
VSEPAAEPELNHDSDPPSHFSCCPGCCLHCKDTNPLCSACGDPESQPAWLRAVGKAAGVTEYRMPDRYRTDYLAQEYSGPTQNRGHEVAGLLIDEIQWHTQYPPRVEFREDDSGERWPATLEFTMDSEHAELIRRLLDGLS